MFQQIPQTVTTTELQRDPKIIDRINKNRKGVVILRDSKQLGVYIPIQTYRKQTQKYAQLLENKKQKTEDEEQKELEKDLKKIRELAGGLKLSMDYTPEELNEIFEKSYETDIQMLS